MGDGDLEELAKWAGIALLGIMVLNYIRDQSAATAGGDGTFSGDAPSYPALDQTLDILDPMNVSPSGIAAIKQREGLTLVAKGDGAVQEIGYGHDIKPTDNITSPITPAEANQLLTEDLGFVAAELNATLTQAVTQSQFDALASLVYNIGNGAWESSSILTDINAGDYAQAAQDFLLYNKSGGQFNQGLANRRQGEQNQFNGG
jgi:lysozyme